MGTRDFAIRFPRRSNSRARTLCVPLSMERINSRAMLASQGKTDGAKCTMQGHYSSPAALAQQDGRIIEAVLLRLRAYSGADRFPVSSSHNTTSTMKRGVASIMTHH